MTLIPDVPLVIVVIHFAALGVLLTRAIISSRQRIMLLRQNRLDASETR